MCQVDKLGFNEIKTKSFNGSKIFNHFHMWSFLAGLYSSREQLN